MIIPGVLLFQRLYIVPFHIMGGQTWPYRSCRLLRLEQHPTRSGNCSDKKTKAACLFLSCSLVYFTCCDDDDDDAAAILLLLRTEPFFSSDIDAEDIILYVCMYVSIQLLIELSRRVSY